MKYFHRTHVSPDAAIAAASEYFGARLGASEESERRRAFAGPIGEVSVTVAAEGGHYTLVTVVTNQPAESEIDKFAKRFLTLLHTSADPTHRPIGAY